MMIIHTLQIIVDISHICLEQNTSTIVRDVYVGINDVPDWNAILNDIDPSWISFEVIDTSGG